MNLAHRLLRSRRDVESRRGQIRRLKHPAEEADIGEVIVSAEDGRVLRSDLKPERAEPTHLRKIT